MSAQEGAVPGNPPEPGPFPRGGGGLGPGEGQDGGGPVNRSIRTIRIIRSIRWAVVAPAFLLFLLHAALFGGWLIDDAGISFAYARSLAGGHGLVAQPGAPPVEGFSNPLWVFLLAPAFALGLFHPVWTAKLLSVALVLLIFLFLDHALARLGLGRLATVLVLFLLAACTPFVVWSVSGLENPLYVALLCLLFALVVWDRGEEEGPPGRISLLAGATAAGLALTRPDGVLFAALYPLLTLRRPAGSAARRLALFTLAFALLFGGYLAFRLAYFGDLYPNTYRAKGGPGARDLEVLFTMKPPAVEKSLKLMRATAGPGAAVFFSLLAAGTAFLLARRRFRRGHGALLAFLAAAALVYLLLPPDWMAEHRFATPFFPFLYAYAVALAAALGEPLPPRPRRLFATAGAVALLGLALPVFLGRSLLFAADPTVPFATVAERWGLRFNRFADRLGLERGSILLPDIGGTLFVSRLRVHDLVGLCDPVIARTLKKDQPAFYDYVFDRLKPTFIHVHQYWTVQARLDLDPRFRRDYLPLHEFLEPQVLKRSGAVLYSGDFLRKEVAARNPEAVLEIQRELAGEFAREQEKGQAAGR